MIPRLVAVVLLLVVGRAHADPRPFRISPPAGWTEITTLPKERLAELPPALTQQLKNAHYELMAMDFEHTSGGFTPNMNVVVTNGSLEVTRSSVHKLGEELASQMIRAGMQATLLTARMVTIDSVDAARFELDSAAGDIKMHQLIYLLPGGKRTAAVTFSSSPDQFSSFEALFDETAAASRGLTKASTFDWPQVLLIGLLGGLGAGLFGLLQKRKQRKQGAS